jgi:hypothetical protein
VLYFQQLEFLKPSRAENDKSGVSCGILCGIAVCGMQEEFASISVASFNV